MNPNFVGGLVFAKVSVPYSFVYIITLNLVFGRTILYILIGYLTLFLLRFCRLFLLFLVIDQQVWSVWSMNIVYLDSLAIFDPYCRTYSHKGYSFFDHLWPNPQHIFFRFSPRIGQEPTTQKDAEFGKI